MVATTNHYTSSLYSAEDSAYSGVVRIDVGGSYGTGALLHGGRAVLTAAHLWDDSQQQVASNETRVHFQLAGGEQLSINADRYKLYPGYQTGQLNHDLALVWLSEPAPTDAWRYTLYRDDPKGEIFNLVGYGIPATGSQGYQQSLAPTEPTRLSAWNSFDLNSKDLGRSLERLAGLEITEATQLVADFDNGRPENDALGVLFDTPHLGLGAYEGMITPGDSGGPALIDGKIAGVASYSARLVEPQGSPDIDDELNGTFGELGVWQNTSHPLYQQWIDQQLRANYLDAPALPEEVQTEWQLQPNEQQTTYFMLKFFGDRETQEEKVLFHFSTRDGTAKAGVDYLHHEGVLALYSDEKQAVIPVTLIGREEPENELSFYMDLIYQPPEGELIELTAQRSFLVDDWIL